MWRKDWVQINLCVCIGSGTVAGESRTVGVGGAFSSHQEIRSSSFNGDLARAPRRTIGDHDIPNSVPRRRGFEKDIDGAIRARIDTAAIGSISAQGRGAEEGAGVDAGPVLRYEPMIFSKVGWVSLKRGSTHQVTILE
jgi:hypothetical protein